MGAQGAQDTSAHMLCALSALCAHTRAQNGGFRPGRQDGLKRKAVVPDPDPLDEFLEGM